MNPIRSTTFQTEKSRSTGNEDHDTYSVLRSRTEEEKQRHRQEWQRQQEREKQHEKLKQQKILEYERKRTQALKYAEEKSSHHSRSKSGSESPSHLRYRGRSTSTASKFGSLHEKLDGPTSGTVPLFRGPQNAQINTMELRRIKVDIHRNIPVKGPVIELQRDIVNPEDVIVKRREGEGCKPIFDREELKKATNKTNEVEERRTVIVIDKEELASTIKSHILRRRSLSLSPIRNRAYSSGYPPSYQSSHRIDLKHRENKTEKCDNRKNDRRGDLEERREYKEKYMERDAKHDTDRSRSREPHSHNRSFMEERSYRDRYRERSNERSHERRDRERERGRERDRERDRERNRERDRTKDRDRSRERRDISHYIESPIPVPIYYGIFPPPPIISSMSPLSGPIPLMTRNSPALMASINPRFPHQTIPPRFPNMYRLRYPPSIPNYGPF